MSDGPPLTHDELDKYVRLLLRQVKELKGDAKRRAAHAADCTYRARVGRAAKRAGKTYKKWVRWCVRKDHKDPTRVPKEMLTLPRIPKNADGALSDRRDRLYEEYASTG